MSATVPPPQVEVHDVVIDHVNVRDPRTADSAQKWNALTPLLTVLITAVGLVITVCFNLWQNHTSERQKVDSDWREALSRGIGNEDSAGLLALEMETFATDPVYGAQAKSIIYASLPRIKSEGEFDTAFHGALYSTMEEDQDALISVLRKLSLDVEKRHDDALKTNKGSSVADQSLGNFVKDPGVFLDDDSPVLAEMNVLTYKLDSAAVGLSSLWRGTKTRGALQPGQVDLSGLIFFNNDFHGVDFRQAPMGESLFVGRCRVDAAMLPTGPTVQCSAN